MWSIFFHFILQEKYRESVLFIFRDTSIRWYYMLICISNYWNYFWTLHLVKKDMENNFSFSSLSKKQTYEILRILR